MKDLVEFVAKQLVNNPECEGDPGRGWLRYRVAGGQGRSWPRNRQAGRNAKAIRVILGAVAARSVAQSRWRLLRKNS